MAKDKEDKGVIKKFLRAIRDGSAVNNLAKQVGELSPDEAKRVAVVLAKARLAARSIDVAVNEDKAVFDFDNPWDSTKRLESDARAAATIALKDMDPKSVIKQIVSYTGLLPTSNAIVSEAQEGAKAVADKVHKLVNRQQPIPSTPNPLATSQPNKKHQN